MILKLTCLEVIVSVFVEESELLNLQYKLHGGFLIEPISGCVKGFRLTVNCVYVPSNQLAVNSGPVL